MDSAVLNPYIKPSPITKTRPGEVTLVCQWEPDSHPRVCQGSYAQRYPSSLSLSFSHNYDNRSSESRFLDEALRLSRYRKGKIKKNAIKFLSYLRYDTRIRPLALREAFASFVPSITPYGQLEMAYGQSGTGLLGMVGIFLLEMTFPRVPFPF